jgi:hypothetical protein
MAASLRADGQGYDGQNQLTRLRNGCVWRQIPASIGETVRGYVDDAENDERFIHGGFYNNNNRA